MQSVRGLKDALRRVLSLDLVSTQGAFNHIPQGIIALHKLGADENRFEDFENFYSADFHSLSQVAVTKEKALSVDDWSNLIGKRRDLYGLRSFFRSELNHRCAGDSHQLVQEYLPYLIPGISAGLFHPLMHISWATTILDDCPDEGGLMIADGLAALTYKFQPLGASGTKGAPKDTTSTSLLKILAQSMAFDPTEASELCRSYIASYDRKRGIEDSSVPNILVNDITSTVWLLYAASDQNVPLLHCVNCWHGLRSLLPSLAYQNQRQLIRAYLVAMLKIYSEQCLQFDSKCYKSLHIKRAFRDNHIRGAAELFRQDLEAKKMIGQFSEKGIWPAIRDLGLRSFSPHLGKLIYVCLYDGYEHPQIRELEPMLWKVIDELLPVKPPPLEGPKLV